MVDQKALNCVFNLGLCLWNRSHTKCHHEYAAASDTSSSSLSCPAQWTFSERVTERATTRLIWRHLSTKLVKAFCLSVWNGMIANFSFERIKISNCTSFFGDNHWLLLAVLFNGYVVWQQQENWNCLAVFKSSEMAYIIQNTRHAAHGHGHGHSQMVQSICLFIAWRLSYAFKVIIKFKYRVSIISQLAQTAVPTPWLTTTF